MATHSSVLAWRIPGTGEPGGLPSLGSHRVGHDWSDLAAAAAVFLQANVQVLLGFFSFFFKIEVQLIYNVSYVPQNDSVHVCACVRAQLYLTFCNSMDCSPPGSSVYGISQARILEWLPFPTPGDLPEAGIEPMSFVSPALAGGFFTSASPEKPIRMSIYMVFLYILISVHIRNRFYMFVCI